MNEPGYVDGRQGDAGGRPVRVTVTDLETGEQESIELRDDYVLIAAGRVYLASTQAYKNGTHVLTVKREARRNGMPDDVTPGYGPGPSGWHGRC